MTFGTCYTLRIQCAGTILGVTCLCPYLFEIKANMPKILELLEQEHWAVLAPPFHS
jgi:hypothetical protein